MKCPVCDSDLDKIGHNSKPRSYQQHKRFFKMITVAFNNWPENHTRQFSDDTECRKFLTMKAGWFVEASRMPVMGMRSETAVIFAEAMFKAAGNFAIAMQQGNDIVVWKPRSIAYDKLSHTAAGQLFDKVSDVIKNEIGISGDELLERQKEVA